MKFLVKGLPGTEIVHLEIPGKMIETCREERKKKQENPRKYNTPMAEFILKRIREERGNGYNYEAGYECVLNGNLLLLSQILNSSDFLELYIQKFEEDDIEEELLVFEKGINDRAPPYTIDISKERVMRN